MVTRYVDSTIFKEKTSRSVPNIRVKRVSLSLADKGLLLVSCIVVVILIVANMLVQMDTKNTKTAIANTEANTAQLQAHTDLLLNNLSSQYNYDVIKEAAKKNQMTIDSSRVRSVD
ncbi:hypothetical protein [Tuanshanicoccus lijuaniae]|uniref:hypothetical protein n=1 Tax=Aerococcaceae bacterium zg-1292 TaxID=2774330 RepID=UPI001BD82DD0|nr:hypothetical protein [Aerococcaceae bacterium zg-A91]MBS4457273.1 hypothetical protein [Aerococcaceae bacterium zg-BR33]